MATTKEMSFIPSFSVVMKWVLHSIVTATAMENRAPQQQAVAFTLWQQRPLKELNFLVDSNFLSTFFDLKIHLSI